MLRELRDSITSRIRTAVTVLLGTSMPTAETLVGHGAIRTPLAPSARAMSSLRLVILLSFSPDQRELIPGTLGVDDLSGLGIHAEGAQRLRQPPGLFRSSAPTSV